MTRAVQIESNRQIAILIRWLLIKLPYIQVTAQWQHPMSDGHGAWENESIGHSNSSLLTHRHCKYHWTQASREPGWLIKWVKQSLIVLNWHSFHTKDQIDANQWPHQTTVQKFMRKWCTKFESTNLHQRHRCEFSGQNGTTRRHDNWHTKVVEANRHKASKCQYYSTVELNWHCAV